MNVPITEENLAQFSLYIFNILKNKIDLLWETNAGKLLFRAISGVDIIAWVSDTKLGEMKFLDELAYDSKPFNPPSTAKSDVIENRNQNHAESRKKTTKFEYTIYFQTFFSLTFAVVHHGSTTSK